jgi:hypothetical protein
VHQYFQLLMAYYSLSCGTSFQIFSGLHQKSPFVLCTFKASLLDLRAKKNRRRGCNPLRRHRISNCLFYIY